jgi:hypothetical protein
MQPNGFRASLLCRETSDTSDVGNTRLLMLYDSASVPAPGVNTDTNPNIRFGVSRRSPTHASPNRFFIFYLNPAGTFYYWDGSAWQAEPTITHFGGSGQYEVRLWDDGTNFKADVIDWWTGVSVLANVASIAKSSVKAFSSGRALINGDQYTSHYYLGQKFDNLLVSQYLLPEPAWGSWSAEEAN